MWIIEGWFFKIYLFILRESQHEPGGADKEAEWEREKENPNQAPHCQIMTWAEIMSGTLNLNWWSHAVAPRLIIFKK